jgi:uncharacterized OB-fold protein
MTGNDQALFAAAAEVLASNTTAGASRPIDLLIDAHGIAFQQCLSCGYLRYPAARHCPECLSDQAQWQRDSGRGTVYASAVYHRSFHAAFKAAVPYVVALIQLRSGPQLFSALLSVEQAPAAGTPVRAVIHEVMPDGFVAYFEPTSEAQT